MHHLNIDNNTFLSALFKEDAPFAHITDFSYDPGDIPREKHLIAWKGDWASRYQTKSGTNQYFTISIFNPDDEGVARRRKALFLRTRVIVLDDVKEKLPISEVQKLPAPSWILESSVGSEQWGYILTTPESSRNRVENLLDGLVANGLSPSGSDPGMKGVTRYVRLPEGYNTKASRFVDGLPFKCRITSWNPERTVTMEQLAEPFQVDLNAIRRDERVDGAADLPDHPLLQIPEIIHIKEVRSDGRFDITCPWVEEHTGGDDNGTAIFTNSDGTLGFKCHHGHCQGKTGKDLMRYIEGIKPGFGLSTAHWIASHQFKQAVPSIQPAPPAPPVPPVTVEPIQIEHPPTPEVKGIDTLIDDLRRERPKSPEATALVQQILKTVDNLPEIDRIGIHEEVTDIMRWSKQQFNSVLKDLRSTWYQSNASDHLTFLKDMTYVHELDCIFDRKSTIMYTATQFQNSFCDVDPDIKKRALQDGMVQKAHFTNFDPSKGDTWEDHRGIKFVNMWNPSSLPKGRPGDITPWLEHFKIKGWEQYQDHIIKWMAYTVRNPGDKINHMLIFGGSEGTGKDFLLAPLKFAMGQHFKTIDGAKLLDSFNEYLIGTKFLVINEVELSDHKEARMIANKLKPLAAAPPDKLTVNKKNVTAFEINNVVNSVITTNSRVPVQLHGLSRRFFALWSDFSPRNPHTGENYPEWQKYFEDAWAWMESGGQEFVVDYLMNQVDLKGFKPGLAPPVTDFMREIQNASRSPLEVTLSNFLEHRIGAFNCDLVTASDMAETIRGAGIAHSSLIQTDTTRLNGPTLGKVIGAMPGMVSIMAKDENRSTVHLWALRNADQYKDLPRIDIYKEYRRQIEAAEKGFPTIPGKPNLQIAK